MIKHLFITSHVWSFNQSETQKLHQDVWIISLPGTGTVDVTQHKLKRLKKRGEQVQILGTIYFTLA